MGTLRKDCLIHRLDWISAFAEMTGSERYIGIEAVSHQAYISQTMGRPYLVTTYGTASEDVTQKKESAMAKDQNPAATRKAILDAAFNLFYHNGFQATGLSEIVEQAGVSKGAIYNHFASKLELGYAIVDEVLHEYVLSHWMAPYQELEDPIEATMSVMDNAREFLAESEFNLGCPLNNLVQEMASIDEGFHSRLNQLTVNWVETVARSFARAQEKGSLRPDVNPAEVAGFVVSVFEGTMGLVKCARSVEYLEQNTRQLLTYLSPLRQSDSVYESQQVTCKKTQG